MAKKREIGELEAELEVSTEETDVEKAEQKKPALQEAEVSDKVKMIRIRALENINCIVAGKHYIVEKDKEVSFPIDVASILCFANKAYRL